MNSRGDVSDDEPLVHGGNLATARHLFPGAPEPFIDLSTGINPHSYPLPAFSADIFTRLPEPAGVRQLADIAARAYGAPSGTCVVPAPGTQILLAQVAGLVPAGRAAILGPTYAEHLRSAKVAGHEAAEVASLDRLERANLAVVVNPNNPDGRLIPRAQLLALAEQLSGHDGLLVVDEAFMDAAPGDASLAGDVDRENIVVLRSFGKFYGLAGVRLGFALAAPDTATRLDAMLGPWAVSGPALAIGQAALPDDAWRRNMRTRLDADTARLDRLFANAGLEAIGGTSLFRLARCSDAAALFAQLGEAGIFVRRFDEHPSWLRWGLPASDAAWQRVAAALSSS
jgi:cobalamin biosynthesis protein CobC